jgi:cell division protein FtsW
MYFLAGAKLKEIGWLVGGAAVLAVLAILLTPFRRERVLAFLQLGQSGEGSEAAAEVDTWHVDQLLLGLGRGGTFGQGIGNSRQKYSFVPEPSTDSIFAIVGEEIGFVGGAVILALYLFCLYLIFRVVTLANLTTAERLLGYGILILLASQIFLNIAAISSLTPLTGITLPFFSYGRSSLIISLVMMGVVLGLGQTSGGGQVVKKRQTRIIKR